MKTNFKKALSSVLAVMLSLGCMSQLAVSADASKEDGIKYYAVESFADYIPGEKPANMMTEPNKGDVFGNINASDSSIAKAYNSNSGWSNTYGGYYGYFIEAVADTVATPAYYSKLSGVVTTNGVGGLAGKSLTPGKAYVLSFLARNAGTTDSATVNFGLGNVDTWASCVYSLENGDAGYTVEDKTEWTKVAGTLIAPSQVPYLSIGFPNGTPAGTKIEANLSYLPEDAIYFAEEVAYKINASADTNEAKKGEVITATAEVLNQVGTNGSLSQNFDWYVVNADRTAVVDGFNVNATGNTAVITAEETVADGDYVIVAVYGENMVKGIPVTVAGSTSDVEDFSDSIVVMPENMMDTPTSGNVFGNANSSTVEKKFSASDWNQAYATYNGYQITAINETSNNGSYANVSGITTTKSAGGLKDVALEAGKAYVVSFLGRNNGTTDSFKINMGLTNADGNWLPTYTLEKGEAGYEVSDKENWTKIAGTFVAPCASPFLSIGFMNGMPQGSGMEFNLAYIPEEAIYFAEEVAYEISFSADKTSVANGEALTVSADVLNQVGTKGSLSQNAEWTILNADRDAVMDNFAVSSNGNTAIVTPDSTVEAGVYVAYAVTEAGIKKGFEFTVTEAEKTPVITVTSVDMKDYAGKAWDVLVENFDRAYSYTAVFTDGAEEKTGEIDFANVEADGGSTAFAVFLHTSRANVMLDIIAQ